MKTVKISVVIPVYNAEEYLDRCLFSILSQDFKSYEVILVDDGSSDSSPMICDRYSSTDSRFRTIHKSNGGVSSARNAGLNLVKGEYVMFVDSDDALPQGSMKAMYEAADSKADFVLGGFDYMVNEVRMSSRLPAGHFFEGESISVFFDKNVVRNGVYLNSPWAKLFSHKVLKSTRLSFNQSLSYGEDMIFVNTFLQHVDSIAVVGRPVYTYYEHGGSLGSDTSSDKHINQLLVLLPLYAEVISKYRERYPSCNSLSNLYHADLVGRFVFRILRLFTIRKTRMLTSENLKTLYAYLDKDDRLHFFSVRLGQVINVLLYKIGSTGLARLYYKCTSGLFSIFS